MRDRSELSRRRARLLSRLALASACAVASAEGAAGEHRRARAPLPANALPPPGGSLEGYPPVGPAQVCRIAEKTVGSTLAALAARPLPSLARIVGRPTERVGVRIRELSTTLIPAGPTHPRPPCGDLGGGAGGPPMPARITLLPASELAVSGLIEMLGSALSRVDLMIYGWEDDPTGREVAQALAACAGRGVRVRLIVDRGGFLIHNPAAARGEPTFLDELRALPNVSVIEPPNPFFTFDHRKLAVADGRVAWTGGMILTEVARRRWENLAYLVEGPPAATLADVFELRWREVGGCPGPPLRDPRSTAPCPNATVRLIETGPGDRSLKAALYQAVDRAQHHVYLENPYFSDELLTAKLGAAGRRGVDVRAVVTLRGNIRSLNRYVVLTANRLLRSGVRVYLAPTMTHVKAMSVDGVWSYLGTGNFDELSLRNNREVGLAVSSAEVASALDCSLFLPHIAAAEELAAPLPPPSHRWLLELLKVWY